MSKRVVLPQPSEKYDPESERIRNREIESFSKAVNQKLIELEERIKALEP